MTCRRALAVLMAEADEHPRAEVLAARHHASRCPRCSSAYDPADPTAAALGVFAVPGEETAPILRVGLVAVAVTQLVFAIPWIVGKSLLPDSHVAVSHLTRDGALGLVIAALGLITVWQPRYAHATRLMGFLVLGLQLAAGIDDRQAHLVSGVFEIVHLPVVLIVFGLCAIAADVARRATPRATPRSRVLHRRATPAPH
ncbi:MAG: hypothetical protein QOI44_558 [Actinomycetota bacterium]|nr:hypothetical protein [Actinomycetota bacterium]